MDGSAGGILQHLVTWFFFLEGGCLLAPKHQFISDISHLSWWTPRFHGEISGHFGHSYAMLRLTTPMWGRDQIRLSWHRTSWPLHHQQQKCCLPGIKVVLGDPRTRNREKLTHITWLTFGLMRYKYIWLVVEPTPLKNDGVRQLGLLFPTEWKNKTCSKPPTRYIVNVCWWVYNQTSLWGLTLYQIIKKLSLVSEQTWAELVPHTVDGRNPAPPWMVETL